ncbi:flagellar export chaperone FliS [Pseudogracilibacillus auburnensis]|uniref:Flagellar secretion chaperone FliS n=1 Tax=Pseudogracilibacillus auburnensis TaxID=1494959 RepID=A0A2V3W955_9BACI|nr:flagellar export chaperone FliS [Pseudogracilibacillus auburnensis]MBO1001548.1 flagellar export chaperone FliS [Pseudogracilibacillus auburnensis]PXW89531.1 flagellar protein FliS [Pseudogracilibacillus auburnensis]
MMTKQFQTYQNNAVNTASGPQLTMMLYNGCIKFINQAIKAVNDNDHETKNTNIQKAQDIVQELMLTLDQEVEISKQLLSLYEFIYFQLQQGNIKSDVKYLEEALAFITEFRNTWKEVMKTESSSYVQGAQV